MAANYTLTDASMGWSVYNIFRSTGLTDDAAIAAFWEDEWGDAGGAVTADYEGWVADGITFLVAEGFITYPGDAVTAVELDAFNKPKRLRRTEEDPDVLEFLPDGAQPESI